MPKIVDHDARRQELAEVVWRLIAREGLEAVTTRRIASEAGYSNGSLLYYFSSKEEAIRAAYEFVFDATNKRADARERQRHGLAGLRTLCREIMPLDAERVLESKVAITFWQQAISAPEKGERTNEMFVQWHSEIATRLREAILDGHTQPDIDVDMATDELLSMLMGLQVLGSLLADQLTVQRQEQMLESFLNRLRPQTIS